MKFHFTSIFNKFTVVALLVALIGSAVQVTPARAASIVVNSNADNLANDGFCTLREAIVAAVSNLRSGSKTGECAKGSSVGVDSISFAGNYTITVGSQLPFATSVITITGKGAANTIIQAAATPNTATWRVFQVAATGNLTLDGVTVRNGQCNTACTTLGGIEANAGGSIHNSGTLMVKNSTISGNYGTLGGGIYNLGTLMVSNTTFSDNHAFRISGSEDGGGAIYNSGTLTVTDNSMFLNNSAEKNGGAIFSAVNSILSITNSTISGNTGFLGGGIFNNHGTMTVTDSIISDNTSSQAICCDDGGGGIRNTGTLTVTNSVFSGNDAKGGGAILNYFHLTVKDSTFSGNTGGYGGGIHNGDCITYSQLCSHNDATIINTVFSNNSATVDSGAIYNSYTSTLKVQGSTFLNNTSEWSGALGNLGGPMEIDSSTFSGNIAQVSLTGGGYGGAIHNTNYWQNDPNRPANAPPTVTNSTFYGNSASAGGGAIAIRYPNTSIVVTNSTISGNSGSAIYNQIQTSTTLKNTIVANNSGGNCFGTITDGGYNLDSSTTCGFASIGSLSNTNPMLGALANNGGLTKTMKLLAGSPAIDAGNASFCSASPVSGVDQRGVNRPLGSGCDIGAFETTNGAGPDTVGVFRPSNGVIFLKNLNISGFADLGLNYGTGGDYPVVGDWDGNGTKTIGVYRNGVFLLRNSNSVGFANITVSFGSPGDQPIAGDWNGDGLDTIGVYQSSTGTFLLRNSNTPGAADLTFALGNPGDVGIAGDWNGDGIDTTGVFRPSSGVIFLKNTNTSGFANIALNYGVPGDQPVVGDWDNNGTTTVGIYRNGRFYLRNSNTNGFANIQLDLGNLGDMPIAGNWDGIP